jgi:type I restriction enzyme S subunit
MHKNENRPGYKNSKVGLIPVGWEFSSLGNCAIFLDNQRIPLKDEDRQIRQGKYPYYGASGIIDYIDDYLFDDELILLGEDGANILSRSTPLSFRVQGKIWVNNHAHVIKPKDSTSIGFLCEYLESISYAQYNTGTAQPKLNREICSQIPIPLPPLPEQKAIAGVLECWDRGISGLELKIEKKRLIKNGLMQRLLSGKQRLKGFTKAWQRVELGNVFDFVATYAFSRECLTTETIDNSDIYNIHYGDIHATYTGPILDLAKERRVPMLKTSDALPDKLEFLQEGDLVMADVSEDYEGIGACIELKNLANNKLTGGLHTFVMRDTSSQTAAGFRGYMFQEYRLAKELKRIATGVSVYSLSKTNLAKIELLLPPLDEQHSITSVLWGADKEIAAMEKKLVLWNEQKKYLLNNLVTGTIRLPQFCVKA